MRACGIDLHNDRALQGVDFYTSHEALILPYEQALTRRDSLTGAWYDCSAHFLWVGDRTRQLDGAHVSFLSGLANPLGMKVGPSARVDDILHLVEALNPDNTPGRLTLISRMGKDRVTDLLGPLIAALRDEGRSELWTCDPMHANTFITPGGHKTRRFEDVLAETSNFFALHRELGTWPGGLGEPTRRDTPGLELHHHV
jgi:3-deoxy-7-phosphoheptulonate synthase